MSKPNDAWVDPDSGEPRVTPRPAPHKRPPREAGAAQAPQQPQAEREAFEAWAASEGGNITHHATNADRYASATVQGWWKAWQAGAGLQAAPQVPAAWVARCHQDTMDTVEGQISWGSLTERGPFECSAPDVWECVPVYLAAPPEAALQPSPEARGAWISVSDRVPDPYTPVLALAGNVVVARREAKPPHQAGGYGWLVSSCGDRNVPWLDVTHWMPLPELPARGTECDSTETERLGPQGERPGGDSHAPKEGAVREDVVQRLMRQIDNYWHTEPQHAKFSARTELESAIRTALQGSARDAARYQWLTSHKIVPQPSLWDQGVGFIAPLFQRGRPSGFIDRAQLSAAIDAAMQGSARADQGEQP